MTNQNKQEKMKALTDKLEQGVKDVYKSDSYQNYLAVMSKFYFYSFREQSSHNASEAGSYSCCRL